MPSSQQGEQTNIREFRRSERVSEKEVNRHKTKRQNEDKILCLLFEADARTLAWQIDVHARTSARGGNSPWRIECCCVGVTILRTEQWDYHSLGAVHISDLAWESFGSQQEE